MLKEKKKVAWEEEGAAMGDIETETFPAATHSRGQRTSLQHVCKLEEQKPLQIPDQPSFPSQMETGGDTKGEGLRREAQTDRRPTTEKSGRRGRHCEEGMEQEVG